MFSSVQEAVSPVIVACLASRAVCVAVDIGRSASVASFKLLESETSASIIKSHVAGVTAVVSVGKIMLLIVLNYEGIVLDVQAVQANGMSQFVSNTTILFQFTSRIKFHSLSHR